MFSMTFNNGNAFGTFVAVRCGAADETKRAELAKKVEAALKNEFGADKILAVGGSVSVDENGLEDGIAFMITAADNLDDKKVAAATVNAYKALK